MESDLWPDKGAYNTNITIRYRYKEDEREKKLEFHSEYYYENFGRDRSDYSFRVNKETGDINCNIRNVTDY